MSLLWAIVALLVILWLLGLIVHIAGAAIHLLLVVAIIVAIASFIGGRRTAA